MYHQDESDEAPDFRKEDYEAGRLEWQARRALEAKKVRQHLIAHPGANPVEIRAATGIVNVSAALAWLQQRGFIRHTMQGPEVIPL